MKDCGLSASGLEYMVSVGAAGRRQEPGSLIAVHVYPDETAGAPFDTAAAYSGCDFSEWQL